MFSTPSKREIVILAVLNLPSGNASNLDRSKILLFGKVLIEIDILSSEPEPRFRWNLTYAYWYPFNSLQNNKISDPSELKAFADDKISVNQKKEN